MPLIDLAQQKEGAVLSIPTQNHERGNKTWLSSYAPPLLHVWWSPPLAHCTGSISSHVGGFSELTSIFMLVFRDFVFFFLFLWSFFILYFVFLFYFSCSCFLLLYLILLIFFYSLIVYFAWLFFPHPCHLPFLYFSGFTSFIFPFLISPLLLTLLLNFINFRS